MFKITTFDDDILIFSNGDKIECLHYADCCERNWADFSVLSGYPEILEQEYADFSIKPVDGVGFILILEFTNKYNIPKKDTVLIPCYSDQNGYYSDDIDVYITKNGKDGGTINLQCHERFC